MTNTYRDGYQAALDDIARSLQDGGISRALQWVAENAASEDTRTTARAARENVWP